MGLAFVLQNQPPSVASSAAPKISVLEPDTGSSCLSRHQHRDNQSEYIVWPTRESQLPRYVDKVQITIISAMIFLVIRIRISFPTVVFSNAHRLQTKLPAPVYLRSFDAHRLHQTNFTLGRYNIGRDYTHDDGGLKNTSSGYLFELTFSLRLQCIGLLKVPVCIAYATPSFPARTNIHIAIQVLRSPTDTARSCDSAKAAGHASNAGCSSPITWHGNRLRAELHGTQ